MNELKPEDVMRAFECLVECTDSGLCNDSCPQQRNTYCRHYILKDALTLLREKDATLEMCAEVIKRQDKELAEKDAKIERLIKERDEARTDVGCSERNHYESEKEVERLKHILECYALQYGTTRDKECFLNKAREETITGFMDRVLALNTSNKKFFVIGKDEIDRIAWDMSKMPRYQSYVRTPQDMRSLYERVKANPSIKQYRGYTASKSYGYDTETQKIIVKEGEFWFDNPSFRGT